jgi:hypothetical protein
MATGFQTNRSINNLYNCERIYVTVCSCKRCEESERKVAMFLIQALWDVAPFHLVNQPSAVDYCLHLHDPTPEK